MTKYDLTSWLRASTLDVVNVPNVKYLAHLPHQTPKDFIYQMLQIL